MGEILRALISEFNVKRGYFTDEGRPLICPYCNSGDIQEYTVCWEAGSECEVSYRCGSCSKEVGFWAYGAFDPDYVQTFYWRTIL